MVAILSIMFKSAGVVFLLVAAIGVVKFSDPFQRMHAATKAGTLGAGLVIIGSVIAHGELDAVVLGVMTVVFLLLTVPVAGHLLGRAAYVSGARLALAGEDALTGVLRRSPQSLDERLEWGTAAGWQATAGKERPSIDDRGAVPEKQRADESPARQPATVLLANLQSVSFAVIDGHVRPVAERACKIAARHGASLTAYVLIDKQVIQASGDELMMRRLIRERASTAIHELKDCTRSMDIEHVLNYDEGDPEQILASRGLPGEEFLVLPCEGWFHHQVSRRLELTTWEPDGLLRLPSVHRGPVLFVTSQPRRVSGSTLVVRDCNEPHLASLVAWALVHELWSSDTLVHVHVPNSRHTEIRDIAERFGHRYLAMPSKGDGCDIPESLDGVCGVILGHTPRPLRTSWYGNHWRNRIAPGMIGDVLIMEAGGVLAAASPETK